MASKKQYTTQQIKELIIEEALKQNVDPALALAVAEHESGFNPNAKNFTSAEKSYGLFQINTKAHPNYKDEFDVKQNINYGIGILKDSLKKAGGDPYKALAIYNGGVGGQKASIRNGYPQAVTKLVNKHRNNTVPNSTYITNKARGVKMADNNNNGKMLEGKVSSSTGAASPITKEGLQNILDAINSGTNLTEQRFRNNIQPSRKAWWYDKLVKSGFDERLVAQYVAETGDTGAASLKADFGWNENNLAPWEGGKPFGLPSTGERQRAEYERIANDRLLSDINTVNQYYSPEAVAAREQSMRDRLTGAFNRYNEMNNLARDPRLQNQGYHVDPEAIERAADERAALTAFYGGNWMQQQMTPQQRAQLRYEAQIANQYGVPYEQVMQAQKDQVAMYQALMKAQIEKDLAMEMQFAQTPQEQAAAMQKANDRYYEMMQKGMEKQYEIENSFEDKGYDMLKAGVAPTITGSSNIYEKGLGISGDVLGKEIQGGIDLEIQRQKDREQAIREQQEQETQMNIKRMELDDPYNQVQKWGNAAEGFAATQGYNPDKFNQNVMYTPFGSMFYPVKTPPTNLNNNNNNNADGGLRIPTNNNIYNRLYNN